MKDFLLTKNNNFLKKQNVTLIFIPDKIDMIKIPNKNSILYFFRKKKHKNNKNAIKKIQLIFNLIKKKGYKYTIIMSRSLCFKKQIYTNFNIPDNIKFIYMAHVQYTHKIIKFLPLGRDFRSKKSFKIANDYDNKDILCYCNFSLDTHSSRKEIYDIIKDKSFIKFENMQTFLNYEINRDKFFERLGRSKFVICPRGKFIDSYRFYDTIYSGAIPIVVKENYHNLDFYKGIPILFLNNVDDFKKLTEKYLNTKYDELIKYKKDYYKGLNFKLFIKNNKKLLNNNKKK